MNSQLAKYMRMNAKVLIAEHEVSLANDLRSMLEMAGYGICGVARSVKAARELVQQERPELVLVDISLSGRATGIDLARELKEQNIAFVYLFDQSTEAILNEAKATQPDGFLVKPFRDTDLLITLEIAWHRHEYSLESKYRREAAFQTELQNTIRAPWEWKQKLLNIGRVLQPFFPFDFFATAFSSTAEIIFKGLSYLRIGLNEYQTIEGDQLAIVTGRSKDQLELLRSEVVRSSVARIYAGEDFMKIRQTSALKRLFIDQFQLESHLTLPVHLLNGGVFNFCLFSRRQDSYTTDHIALFGRIQHSMAESLDAVLPRDPVIPGDASLKPGTPAVMKSQPEIVKPGFEGMVGKGPLLIQVFDLIAQVAPSDTSVLILGETGTGKEMVAGCIHNLSPRKNQRLVKVNCAAIPPTLIESELFGHEKGAFTGSVDKRIGKFEQADGGSIFLDEIGEMSPELQAKLLHVLQDREIERIGAKAPVRVDVRVMAATNRNLEKAVEEGRFRSDLYYRLNVFPIVLPALRDRKEDIAELSGYFISVYNRKAGKHIAGLSDKAIKTLMAYDWPGNIRELEHVIERGVLLEKGTVIKEVPAAWLSKNASELIGGESKTKTIEEVERDHILAVLKKCNGKIWGPGAAAELLNIPPTTLRSKMKKLGIEREYFK
jgi:DNA-binding NtrC family response regulator